MSTAAAGQPDYSDAISQLETALDVCETNEPINRAEGKVEQADLEARCAASYRVAIEKLKQS